MSQAELVSRDFNKRDYVLQKESNTASDGRRGTAAEILSCFRLMRAGRADAGSRPAFYARPGVVRQ